ncbi:MAG: Hsp20/alpha crystallin family protein [Anaerolineae bacterium]|nr:Hsp20/alpha crystallin family protein [Anaerolineae bacterium]
MVYLTRHAYRPFNPPTDVIELADKIVVLVEIAGIRTEELKITLSNQQLVITGLRERPQHTAPAYHQVEIFFGEFRVDVALPWPVDSESVSASYDDGFLKVELPRKAVTHIPIVDMNTTEQQEHS